MQVLARCILLIVLLVSAACGTASQSRELDLLDAVVTLPQEFIHEWGVGDTPCGKLLSQDAKAVIEFDLGFYAGTYAHLRQEGQGWFRKSVIDGIPYQASLDTRISNPGVLVKSLYVTFPDFGPANFWSEVESRPLKSAAA